jgi:glycogen debranching enzyme
MSVSCRFCHVRGHNRNSCPEVTKYAAEARQIIASEGKDEYSLSYRHRFALSVERNKAQISANATAKAEAAKAQGFTSSRKCSYCETMGHTRVKCETLSYDKTTFLQYETRFRNAFALWLKNSGIGIGTMFERVTEWEENKHVVMVTKSAHLDSVNLFNATGDNTICGIFMNREGWENHLNEYPIPSGTGFPFADSRYGYKVVAAAPISFEVPDTYLNADGIKAFVDSLFDEKSKREYRWRRGKTHIGTFHTSRPNNENYRRLTESMETAAVAAQQNVAA